MHSSQDNEGDSGSAARSARAGGLAVRLWWIVPVALVALHLAIAVPLIERGVMTGRWGEDQINYHERVIRTFAQELPRPNLREYHSATTPGYHLVVAAASRVVGDSQSRLQLVGAMFTVLLLGALGTVVALRYRARAEGKDVAAGTGVPSGNNGGMLVALAVSLPVACSMYVFQSGVWLLPDNAGWLGVLLVMVVGLRFRASVGTLAAGSAAMVMVVLFRQIHLWAAGMLWVGAWLSVHGTEHRSERGKELVAFPIVRLRRAGSAFIATLPAFIVLYVFYSMWGGLTPREFQGQYHGFNPAAPAFILAVVGVASVFFIGFISRGVWALVREKRAMLLGAGLIGVVASVVPNTSYDPEMGRFSGLWKIAEKLPLIASHTAPGMVALAVLGSVMAAAWFVALPRREGWFFLAALSGFTAAQSASFQIWQRYNEPFVLMLLAVISSSVQEKVVGNGGDAERGGAEAKLARVMRVAGPLALAGLLAVVGVLTMRKAGPANMYDSGLLPQVASIAPGR